MKYRIRKDKIGDHGYTYTPYSKYDYWPFWFAMVEVRQGRTESEAKYAIECEIKRANYLTFVSYIPYP